MPASPRGKILVSLVLNTSQPVCYSGSSKPGRWHFILGPLVETGLVKESICTAHSTGKSLIACMDQRRRAERGDICA